MDYLLGDTNLFIPKLFSFHAREITDDRFLTVIAKNSQSWENARNNKRSHLVKFESNIYSILTRASGLTLSWFCFGLCGEMLRRLNEIRLSPFTTPFICNCNTSPEMMNKEMRARDNNQKNWRTNAELHALQPLLLLVE